MLEHSDNPNRKTRYSLISVEKKKNGRWVNIDSQASNAVAFRGPKERGIDRDWLGGFS